MIKKTKFDELREEIEITRNSIVTLFVALVEDGWLERERADAHLEAITASFAGSQRIQARSRLASTFLGETLREAERAHPDASEAQPAADDPPSD